MTPNQDRRSRVARAISFGGRLKIRADMVRVGDVVDVLQESGITRTVTFVGPVNGRSIQIDAGTFRFSVRPDQRIVILRRASDSPPLIVGGLIGLDQVDAFARVGPVIKKDDTYLVGDKRMSEEEWLEFSSDGRHAFTLDTAVESFTGTAIWVFGRLGLSSLSSWCVCCLARHDALRASEVNAYGWIAVVDESLATGLRDEWALDATEEALDDVAVRWFDDAVRLARFVTEVATSKRVRNYALLSALCDLNGDEQGALQAMLATSSDGTVGEEMLEAKARILRDLRPLLVSGDDRLIDIAWCGCGCNAEHAKEAYDTRVPFGVAMERLDRAYKQLGVEGGST